MMEPMDIDDSESPIPPHSSLLSFPRRGKHFNRDITKRLDLNSNSLSEETADWSSVRQPKKFSQQYAHTYFVRLLAVRNNLLPLVAARWEGIPLKPIAELCESSSTTESETSSSKTNGHSHGGKWHNVDQSQGSSQGTSEHEQHIALREDITVAIIGTLFKQQPEKPSILQEFVDDIEIRSESGSGPTADSKKRTKFISDKDVLLMEDETTRVRLIPSTFASAAADKKFSIDGLVNGIVCAVKGRPNIDGKFEVLDVIWATPPPSTWPQVKNCSKSKMIFISGLNLGLDKHFVTDLSPIQLGRLFEFLEGLCGSELEQERVAGAVSRVFLIGNCFAKYDPDKDKDKEKEKEKEKVEPINPREKFLKLAETSKKLDGMLSQLAKTMEIYIIPGRTDPVESMYPQPPLHSCLFPTARQYTNFHLLSNPTRLHLNLSKSGDQVLDAIFMDGEPILDAMRYSSVNCPLEMCQQLLQWGHLCPTAPDTLALHPAIKKDPFVLEQLPNLLVVGNQGEFKTAEWNGTKIVTLPAFSESNTIGILTVEDEFACSPMKFELQL